MRRTYWLWLTNSTGKCSGRPIETEGSEFLTFDQNGPMLEIRRFDPDSRKHLLVGYYPLLNVREVTVTEHPEEE